MSLKGFHLVFVTISSLLCLFLALWSFGLSPEASGMVTALGIVGSVGALLMPLYGVYFYRKITQIHI
jgi:DNA-binding transcriptional regulator of glucitol operon